MAKYLFVAVVALCFVGYAVGVPVKVADCGSKISKVLSVDIEPCPEATMDPPQPCHLKKGSEETIHVTFTPNANITAAKTVVHGKIAGFFVPFPVDNPDACKEHGLTCPLTAGQTYVFKTVLPIKTIYPKVKTIVKWEMQDQSSQEVYCWEVSAEIVD